MAYKQSPGRSPFAKTGRDIPLNMTSPLHQKNWFQRLGAEVTKQGGVGGGGVASVAKTTAKNIGNFALSLGRQANLATYNPKSMASREDPRIVRGNEKRYQERRGGKDVFAKD